MAALDLLTGKSQKIRYAWWIDASDEVQEGAWMWKTANQNVTYAAWYQVQDNPNNKNLESFGGADCAAVGLKQDFLAVDIDDNEGNEWREDFEKETDFKWFSISCYTRKLLYVNLIMSPLCKM